MTTNPDYEFVRVSREMVEQLTEGESEPVVLVGLDRRRDGTSELWFKTPPARLVSLDAVVRWLRHVDRLAEVPGAKVGLPRFNPLWDAASALEDVFGGSQEAGT